ncbi:MAG: 2-C-methyl-D-erythritol 2,4-cyclodiphosphate synthase [Bacteroidia bacterium]|nr:2-C-methyl-D-erythritol 2,4-cyclodiphosphate synthase [Bacteroidia bacterium]MCZ2276902.1 2-C-methyl-D-erythritol 2,4-cyclodiphosphate synthase [Bacteroidia bacterium]
MKIRVGFGFDVHRMQDGRPFRLGGVLIPYHQGPEGYSDADVLIHAICDALLGAAGLRDIGYNFPNTSAEYKDIDSRILLKQVVRLLKEKGFETGNIDVTVVLEQPKINPHIENIKRELASLLNLSADDIGIKATTNEKLGYVGREEGICAYAVALIQKKEND